MIRDEEAMEHPVRIYNTWTRRLERFEPAHPPYVGMYVCGPTVYSDPHLGNARPAVFFDVVFRYLMHLGYRVRYVRNITDVGHLEDDADDGEDKIAKRARLERLEPMEIAQKYTVAFHWMMQRLNVLPPSIEPRATCHIIEQIEMVERILANGYAYEVNGSVYFDVPKYAEKYPYGRLSGKKLEDLLAGSRELKGVEEKRSPLDFALWKRAEPEHIMRWPSPWGEGFPGWHLECSVMSTKYLGIPFDIHGGGIDLTFPHHECEIAQAVGAYGEAPVRYWMHNNLILINGQKMSKSAGNFITLAELFEGSHPMLSRPYSPMVLRLFLLQAHYRSPINITEEALQGTERALHRLWEPLEGWDGVPASDESSFDPAEWEQEAYAHLNDDFNTPRLLAVLHEGVRRYHQLRLGKIGLTADDLARFRTAYRTFVVDILGLAPEASQRRARETIDRLMEIILEVRRSARQRKDFETADRIRDALAEAGFVIKDTPQGTEWSWNG